MQLFNEKLILTNGPIMLYITVRLIDIPVYLRIFFLYTCQDRVQKVMNVKA